MRHVAATKFRRGDKILIDLPPNVEVFTPGDLSLQPVAAMSAYDLSLDCTHKAMCCSNVLQRFVASCVPTLKSDWFETLSSHPKYYFLLKLIVLKVCVHEYMNIRPSSYCRWLQYAAACVPNNYLFILQIHLFFRFFCFRYQRV